MSTPRSDVDAQNEPPTNYHFFSSTATCQHYDAMMGRIISQFHSNRSGPVWLELEQHVLARCAQYLILDNRRPIGPVPVPILQIWDRHGQLCTYPYLFTKVLFAQAVLLHADSREPVSMIEARGTYLNPLYGHLNSCCQYISRPVPGDPTRQEAVGAFAFPDLSVRHEGLYVLAFYVWEMINGEAILRGVPTSNTFRVYPAKDFPGMVESTIFTEILKEHGIRVRVSKSKHTSRRRTLHKSRALVSGTGGENMGPGTPKIMEMNEDYEMNYRSREATTETVCSQEPMVYPLLQGTEWQDNLTPTVPPGEVLPIPMHCSPVMDYSDHGNKFAYAQEPQPHFPQRSDNFDQYPPGIQHTQYQMAGHLPPISRMHLPHGHHSQPHPPQWDPVQESQIVSRPERGNGMEFRAYTFFPPPENQPNYQGYNQDGNR